MRARRSLKWQSYEPDVLPLWVAEMDAAPAEPIVAALEEALRNGDTGYPYGTDYPEAFAEFAAAQWDWQLDPTTIVPVADVMTGIAEVLRLITDPGGPVIITPPVWGPFAMCIAHCGRIAVPAQLSADCRLDFGTLEEAFDRSTYAGGRAAAAAVQSAQPHRHRAHLRRTGPAGRTGRPLSRPGGGGRDPRAAQPPGPSGDALPHGAGR